MDHTTETRRRTRDDTDTQWVGFLSKARRILGENADEDAVEKMAAFVQESDAREAEERRLKEEERRLKEEERRLKEEERRLKEDALREAEEERQLKEEERQLKEDALQTIFTHGLLPLGENNNAPTTDAKGEGKPCDVLAGESAPKFGLIEGIVKETKFPSRARNPVKGQTVCSEQSVATPVVDVLNDVVHGLGLSKELSLGLEVAFKFENIALRNDSCVFRRRVRNEGELERWLPCGVQETKRPPSSRSGDGAIVDTTAIGQLYDYMMLLRHMFGVRHVFGILSTYERWRVLWLNDAETNEVAAATTLEKAKKAPHPDDPAELAQIPWRGNGGGPTYTVESVGETHKCPETRECCGTEVIAYNSKVLCDVLATAVKKMSESPVEPPAFLSGRRAYECMLPNDRKWCARPFAKGNQINLGAFTSDAKELYVLRIFGEGGGHGVACLAAAKDGACCVVKFPNDQNEAEAEKTLLQSIWGLNVCVTQLRRRKAIVMPYVRVLSGPEDAISCGVTREAVVQAIDRMVQAGYEHLDLKWSHVGAYRAEASDGAISVVLLDLARVKARDDDSRKRMLDRLGEPDMWPSPE